MLFRRPDPGGRAITCEMGRLVAAHDWAATPLGPVVDWAPSLASTVQLILEHGFPMVLLWGDELIQIYNDGYRLLMGDKHPAGLGQSSQDCWPEFGHIDGPILNRVRSGETLTFGDKLYPTARLGAFEDAWFTLTYSPVRDAGGQVAGILVTLIETTDRIEAEAALRASEERFRAFVTASADVVYRMNPDWTELRQLDGHGFLADTVEPTPNWMERYVDSGDQRVVEQAIRRAIETKSMFELEHRVRRADGSVGWTLSRAIPILDQHRNIREWLGAASDVSGRRRAEEALRESEERLRLIVENARDYAIFVTDAQGIVLDWREGAANVFGYSSDEMVGADSDILFVAEDRQAGVPERERSAALAQGKADDVRWHLRKGGSRIFIEGLSIALRGEVVGLAGFLKIGQDVTERRLSEEHQRLLQAELQHRVRNILAVIRSIIRRTHEEDQTAEEFIQHLEGRVGALARTQLVLSRSIAADAAVESLIRDELVSQVVRQDSIRISGPDVHLPPKAAEVLGLAIHELTTNSIKYGAVSRPGALVEIRWRVEDRIGTRWLALCWSEKGVPIVEISPRREGFGTELITRRVAYELRGRGTLELRPGGIHCSIEFPLGDGRGIVRTEELGFREQRG